MPPIFDTFENWVLAAIGIALLVWALSAGKGFKDGNTSGGVLGVIGILAVAWLAFGLVLGGGLETIGSWLNTQFTPGG